MARPYSNYKSACYLRERDFSIFPGQHWNHFAQKRIDLGKFVDLIVFRPDVGIIAVQACNKHDLSEHRSDVRTNPEAIRWMKSGGLLYIFDWRKLGAAGRRKLWKVRIERAALRDRNERIRFYLVTGAAFELPGGAPQGKSQPAAKKPAAKAPSVAGKAVKIQPAEVLKRRRALMLKRQAERALARNDNQQASPPSDTGMVA